MDTLTRTESVTHIVVERDRERFEVFGPTIQFLVLPQLSDDAPCVIKGTIPPGVSVPIHSHPGVEAFFVLSGNIEVLCDGGEKAYWIAAGPGDFIEVPSNAKHGFRNRSQHPVVQLITTNSKLGRFFREIGRSITRDASVSPPSSDEIAALHKNQRALWLLVSDSRRERLSWHFPFLASRFVAVDQEGWYAFFSSAPDCGRYPDVARIHTASPRGVDR
jgi:quercetin dioxygenase-like cupin family protein